MSVEDIGREPCFWSMTPSSNPGYNLPDRERWIVVDGVKRKEKFPQRGHQGDYEDRRPAHGVRSITMIRHDGNQVEVCLTNAAAHLDPNTPYGQYMMMKARHLGWFSPGSCPAALVATGNLDPGTLLVKDIATAQPCQRGTYSAEAPCPHCVAERDARRQAQREKNDANAQAHKTAADRVADAQGAATQNMAAALAEQRQVFETMLAQSNAQIAALTALLQQVGVSLEGKKK